MDISTEKDIERLRQVALLQDRELKKLHRLLAKLSKKEGDQILQHRLEQLENELNRQRENGGSNGGSERRHSERRRKSAEDKTEQSGHGPTPQPELAIVEEFLELDGDARFCPDCDGELIPFADHSEDSELVDVIERKFVIRKQRRAKYICSCCDHRETAPGSDDQLIPGGRYTVAFAIMIAIAKYGDHLPLHRQTGQYKRQGLTITTQTLWDQTYHLSQLLKPSYDALRLEILNEDVIGLDQTSWRVLSGGKKTRKTWQAWALSSEKCVYHTICERKDTETGLRIVGDFPGTIVCDDASTHTAMVKAAEHLGRAPPLLAGCWAHVRRKFVVAARDFPEADDYLDIIDELFAVERAHRRNDEEPEDAWHRRLLEVRGTKSKPLVQALAEKLASFKHPKFKTSLSAAVKHAERVWPKLLHFLDDPAVWLDNNRTERALRGIVLGRKNHYGSKSRRGTEAAAIFYSLIETAKLAGVEPNRYLREAVTRAKQDPAAVTLPHMLADAD